MESRTPRECIGRDCRLTTAAIWECRGRRLKYSSFSPVDSFDTRPSMRTWGREFSTTPMEFKTPHLRHQRRPIKQHRRIRIISDIQPFPRIKVGEEFKTFRSKLLQQHHPRRRLITIRASAQAHSIRLVDLFAFHRQIEPFLKFRVRLVRDQLRLEKVVVAIKVRLSECV